MKFSFALTLLMALPVPFFNCAKVRAMKADYFLSLSVEEQFQDILALNKFTVEYGHMGVVATDKSVLYTAVFNRDLRLLTVNNSEYSADGRDVINKCTVVRSAAEFDQLSLDLDAIVLEEQAQATAGAGDSWLSFLDRRGHTVRLFFAGSSSANGKQVIAGGDALQALFETHFV